MVGGCTVVRSIHLLLVVSATGMVAYAESLIACPDCEKPYAVLPLEKLVDIYYDAADADNDLLKVRIEISDNDGAKYSVPAFSLTGDIGEGITPGTGKHSRTYGHNGYDNCQRIGFRVCRRHGVTEDTTGE